MANKTKKRQRYIFLKKNIYIRIILKRINFKYWQSKSRDNVFLEGVK